MKILFNVSFFSFYTNPENALVVKRTFYSPATFFLFTNLQINARVLVYLFKGGCAVSK